MMHQRASEIEREARRRKAFAIQAVSAVISLAAVIVMAFVIPAAIPGNITIGAGNGMYASIFSGSSVLGLIVLGIISFALGAVFTVLCYRLKEWRDEGPDGNK